MNYAMDHYDSSPEQLEPGINQTHLIVSFTRQAIIDSLMAEVEGIPSEEQESIGDQLAAARAARRAGAGVADSSPRAKQRRR